MKILSILKANKSKDIFPVDRLPLLKATVFGTTMVTLLLNGSPTIADGFATAEKNVEMLETFNEIPHEKNKFISKISSNNEGYDASIIFDRTQEGDDVRGINLFFPSGVRRSKSWKMTASTVSREEDATVDAVYPNALQGEEKERIRDYKNVIKTEEGEEETHQKGDDRLIISTVGSDPTTLISIVRNRNNDNRDDVSLHVADFHDEALRLQSANSRSVNDLLCTGSSNVMCIGVYSKALGMGSVALGYESQAIRGPGVYGYDPITNTISTKNDQYWKSSHGELGIGNTANGTSRQITGVAAGREDNEAVNVAQLKALRQWTEDNNFFSFRKGGGINGGSEISIGFSGVDAGRVNLINIGHSNGTKRILRGVQNGIADNDAVNMFQLSAFKQEVESYIRFRADAGVGGSELAIGWAGVNIGRVTSITIGHSNGMKRILRGVKEGQINASSDHAMTGSQIFNINKAVENYFGGGAVIGVNGGANTAPIFKIQGTNYRNVSAAFSGVDLSLAQIKKDLAGITQGGNDNALSWNKDIGLTDPSTGKPLGAYDASHGGKLALIANVADGQIDEKSNYVVTGRQIHSINKSVEDYF
ncbi:hypothetical protein ACMX0P_02760, partial [Bartonella ancashensis]